MVKNNLLVIGVGGLLLLLGLGGIVVAYRSPQTQTSTQTYSEIDTERPVIHISEANFDLGTLNVNETRKRDIVVTNVGAKPLELKKFTTSCDCTFVEMIIDGVKSPRFSMHGRNVWSGILAPGETGRLTITYEPAIMPVKGQVERAVLFETNDPAHPRVSVSFTATVN